MKTSLKKDIFLLFGLYVTAFGFMLPNQGYFWDDWIFFNIEDSIAINQFWENGNIWFGYYIKLLSLVSNYFLSAKLITFSLYFFSACILYKLLQSVEEIDRTSRFFIVALFALFPVNAARIQMAPCAAYAMCYFLFFLGFLLTAKYLATGNKILRVSAHVCFLLSFFTNSLLVFFLVVLLYMAYAHRRSVHSIKDAVFTSLKHTDFFLIPVGFWITKNLFFMPRGILEGYNTISLRSFFYSFIYIPYSFYTSFIKVIDASLVSVSFVVLTAGSIVMFFLVRKRTLEFSSSKNDVLFFTVGIVFYCLAVFPYVLVNKLPVSIDWESRHQLLVPLGASLIIFFSIKLLLGKLAVRSETAVFVYSILIAAFVFHNAKIYIEFQIDWYKQVSFIANVKSSPTIKSGRTFPIEDNTMDLNAQNREYRFYEYTGLFKLAFGDETRLAFDASKRRIVLMDLAKIDKFNLRPRYNLSNFNLTKPEIKIVINPGAFAFTPRSFIELLIFERLYPTRFQRRAEEILSVEAEETHEDSHKGKVP